VDRVFNAKLSTLYRGIFVISSRNHRQFVERALSGAVKSECASGSARFVIHPSGKITRCFGLNDEIGSIYSGSVDFIRSFQVNPTCGLVRCFDPCDYDCAEKWSYGTGDDLMFFDKSLPWAGHAIHHAVSSGMVETRAHVSTDLIQINLTPTLLCNYSCEYCVSGSNAVDPKGASRIQICGTSFVTFLRNILSEIRPKDGILIYLSGGEPTIWRGMMELARFVASDSRVSMKINTNGSKPNVIFRITDLFRSKSAQTRLYIQISAHVDEKQFSADSIMQVIETLNDSSIRMVVALVGDESGRLTQTQNAFLAKIEGVPSKIYNDFSQFFMEGHECRD
jgi:organic radical activating enzyme